MSRRKNRLAVQQQKGQLAVLNKISEDLAYLTSQRTPRELRGRGLHKHSPLYQVSDCLYLCIDLSSTLLVASYCLALAYTWALCNPSAFSLQYLCNTSAYQLSTVVHHQTSLNLDRLG